MGKTFEVLGLHWRGGEEDSSVDMTVLEAELKQLYVRMFREFRQAAGCEMPIVLHTIVCKDRAMDVDPRTNKLGPAVNFKLPKAADTNTLWLILETEKQCSSQYRLLFRSDETVFDVRKLNT